MPRAAADAESTWPRRGRSVRSLNCFDLPVRGCYASPTHSTHARCHVTLFFSCLRRSHVSASEDFHVRGVFKDETEHIMNVRVNTTYKTGSGQPPGQGTCCLACARMQLSASDWGCCCCCADPTGWPRGGPGACREAAPRELCGRRRGAREPLRSGAPQARPAAPSKLQIFKFC